MSEKKIFDHESDGTKEVKITSMKELYILLSDRMDLALHLLEKRC